MGFSNLTVGPASVFQYKRNSTSIAAPSSLLSGNMSSAVEDPISGIDGASRLQGNTAYNVSVVFFGAYDQGGLACTVPPANYSYTTVAGTNVAIKASVTAPAYTLAVGLYINDALAAVNATPLSVRNGASGTAEVIAYYLPSAKAVTRAFVTSAMTGITVWGFNRVNFAETTGDTKLSITPVTVTIPRNAGTDLTVVTGLNCQITAGLLASGKSDVADVLNGIASLSGGLKTKQEATFGYRGIGIPSARPIELVVPGSTAGVDASIVLWSALKMSTQQTDLTFSKTNPSTIPVTFVSADDNLTYGAMASFSYFDN